MTTESIPATSDPTTSAEEDVSTSMGPRTTYLLPDGTPDASVLQDRTPPQFKLSRAVTIQIAVIGLLFTVLSYLPVYHSDLWGHLSYGRWILQHGVPLTEPLMPLAAGVPFTDLAWLWEIVNVQVFAAYGIPGIQFLSAAAITSVMALLSGMVYRRTQNVWAALIAVAVFLIVDSQQLTVNFLMLTRPQLAGMVCFAITFGLGTATSPSRWHWGILGVTFALWGNLHGSFLVGIATLGALTVGHYIDVSLRAKHALAGWRSARFRHLLFATELAAAAVLLNPYGIGAYGEAISVAGNANVRDLVEWEPLTLRMVQGQFAAIAAFALVCLYRITPRRVTSGELLLLVGLGALALWTSRMIVWWAPVGAYYIGLHLAAAWKRWLPALSQASPQSGLNTVVALGLCWIYFAYSPFGVTLLHGPAKTADEESRRFRQRVSLATPVELTAWIVNNEPPAGQVFNCFEWGDYLLWAGPPDMQLFVNSHAHLIPAEVWTDYRQVSWGLAGDWQSKLDRYGVNTVIMDKQAHSEMIQGLEGLSKWEKVYEDRLGAVFYRRQPI